MPHARKTEEVRKEGAHETGAAEEAAQNFSGRECDGCEEADCRRCQIARQIEAWDKYWETRAIEEAGPVEADKVETSKAHYGPSPILSCIGDMLTFSEFARRTRTSFCRSLGIPASILFGPQGKGSGESAGEVSHGAGHRSHPAATESRSPCEV